MQLEVTKKELKLLYEVLSSAIVFYSKTARKEIEERYANLIYDKQNTATDLLSKVQSALKE